ncbi:SPFH domain-containing protein [Candidatus Saccharibacteria bacterium]|nr:SPFH domain-containing protein [Candidatus Saccharibacteria bacterium]MCA9328966.1 SPFH domain-containing protein [Candidatus Saccharibacteria bacterium]
MVFVLLVIIAIFIVSGLFTVRQQTAAIVERFGKFKRVAGAGLNFKVPLIDRVSGRMSLRVQQLDVRVETKTKDNVFVFVIVSVQYFVIPEKVVDAFYKLQNAEAQITSYVYDVVRARVPNIILDNVFETKDDIAQAVKLELEQIMDDFGYGIVKALVTDIDPDANVKASMNQINAAQRLRVAAVEQAEADKIRVVKAAEAEAESKALQGQGIANQRMAIVNGLKESVEEFQSNVAGTSAQDVMNLVLMTQYFDTLKEVGLSSNSNTIMIPHSPAGMSDISDQLRNAMITANEISKNHPKAAPKQGA